MTKNITEIKTNHISLPPMGSNLIREWRRERNYQVISFWGKNTTCFSLTDTQSIKQGGPETPAAVPGGHLRVQHRSNSCQEGRHSGEHST